MKRILIIAEIPEEPGKPHPAQFLDHVTDTVVNDGGWLIESRVYDERDRISMALELAVTVDQKGVL